MALSLFRELHHALELAEEAAEILRADYSCPKGVEMKPDGTLVSDVDRKISRHLAENFSRQFPGYSILDEEQKEDPRRFRTEYCWFIDPLDNTQDYLSKEGNNYGTIIGLTFHFQPVMGVVSRQDELFYAVKGQGAYCRQENETRPLLVSASEQIKLLISRSRNNSGLERAVEALQPEEAGTNSSSWVERLNGSLKSLEIARGAATVFVSHHTNITHLWDHCGPSIIVEEAGGKYTDYDGSPLDFSRPETAHRKGAVVTNGKLHQLVLGRLREF